MLYVRSARFLYLALFATTALLSANAHADPANSGELKQYLLSDEQIAEKCQASIKAKVDMMAVEAEDGTTRKIPRRSGPGAAGVSSK